MSRHPEASPLVSVIVPVRDAPAELAVCLDALSAQITDFAFEVIVVDNNSTSSPAHIVARHLRARLIQEPRHAQWAARAAGLAVARGRFLAFTDADCKPSPTWLREGILPLMRSEGCGLVGGGIRLTFRDPLRPTFIERYERATAFRQEAYVMRWRFAATASAFTSRIVLDAVGGVDPLLLSGGDLDLGMRISNAGYDIVYAPAAEVLHPARATFAALVQKTRRVATGLHEIRHRGKYRVRDLIRDLLHDWPLPQDVVQLLRESGGRHPFGSLELLGMLALVKTIRLMTLAQLDLRDRLLRGRSSC